MKLTHSKLVVILALAMLAGCSLMSRATGDKSLEDFFTGPAPSLIEKATDCAVANGCMSDAEAATINDNIAAKQDLIRARNGN